MRVGSLSTLGCAALMMSALLACKKEKKETPPPVATVTPAATPARPAEPVKPAVDENKVYNVGETAEQEDFNLKVSDIKECKAKYTRPKKGNLLLGVETTIGSKRDRNFYASSSSAKVVDGEGLAHNAMGYASTSNCDPTLKGTQLATGEKAKGWLVFEVPKEATGLKLSYSPIVFGESQTVKFDLGR
jgi:hypothetical protein